MSVHEAVVVDKGRTLTRHECSELEVRAALRRLQRRFDLRPSGRLDSDTKKLMSRGRCGNTDTDLQRQPETVMRRTGSSGHRRRLVVGGSLQPEPDMIVRRTESSKRRRRGSSNAGVQRPKPETVLHRTGSRGRRKRSTELETTLQHTGSRLRLRINNTAERPDLQTVLRLAEVMGHGKRSADRANETLSPIRVPTERGAAEMTSSLGSRLSAGIDHFDLHSRLMPGTDHEPGAALTRRTKMFIEIRERQRLQIAAEAQDGVPARRNYTKDELAAILRRIRSGRARRAEAIDDEVPTSRRRRSISVPSFDDRVNEGLATDSASTGSQERVRFQKNGNSPVSWRLLADGVSGKIPLMNQRAILELAFRMWSEVIPLKFHESTNTNVVDMDVIIAFAKRK